MIKKYNMYDVCDACGHLRNDHLIGQCCQPLNMTGEGGIRIDFCDCNLFIDSKTEHQRLQIQRRKI